MSLQTVFASYRRWRRQARTAAVLRGLDRRERDDLGIAWRDIAAVARIEPSPPAGAAAAASDGAAEIGR